MSATFWNRRRRLAAIKAQQELEKQQEVQPEPIELEATEPEQLELEPESKGQFTELVDIPEATEPVEEAPVKEKPKKRATRSKVKDNE